MVRKKLMTYKIIIASIFIFFNFSLNAETNLDQWEDTNKTYKDLIEEGFNVKAYDTNTLKTDNGLILMFFVTVLQKENEIYECQEYQTLDNTLQTLDLSFVCKRLVQPYNSGIGT